ncbi:MAG: YihY/virulence factor BrkB family protein [Deltaproteobacteria bacterium]|nr:YihY/virulence factor BrkB family protein [Deltaproteobacteria bacterium]
MMTPTSENNKHMKESSGFILNTATAWDIVKNAIKDFQYNGCTNMAAAIAFYFILSAFPFFILTIIVSGLVFGSNPNLHDELIKIIQTFHPYFTGNLLEHLSQIEQKMKVLGWLGIILLAWFSSLIFNSAQTSLGIILRSQIQRKYVTSKLLIIVMILIGWTVLVVTIGITYLAAIFETNSSTIIKSWLVNRSGHHIIVRYLVPYLVIFMYFTFVYKIIPKTKISWGNAFSASLLFTTLAEISKNLFSWYIAHYSRYHIIFGSLENLMLFVIWVFYVALIFLFCAELISSYRKRDLLLLEKAFLSPEDG